MNTKMQIVGIRRQLLHDKQNHIACRSNIKTNSCMKNECFTFSLEYFKIYGAKITILPNIKKYSPT